MLALGCCLDSVFSRPFLGIIEWEAGFVPGESGFLDVGVFPQDSENLGTQHLYIGLRLGVQQRRIQERLQWGTASRFLHVCIQGLHPGSHAII